MSMGTDNLELLADAQRSDPRRRALLQRRTRHHPQRADAPDALDRDRGGRPQGGRDNAGARRSTSSRSGSTTAKARSRSSPRNNMPPSSTRRTRPASASPRTSSTGRREGADPRRARCVRARRSRQGRRRRDRGDVQAASESRAQPEPAGPRREGGSELDEAGYAGRRIRKAAKAENIDQLPQVQAFHGIQARNLGEDERRGRRASSRHRRQPAPGARTRRWRTWCWPA